MSHYTKKGNKIKIAEHPELKEFLIDVAKFTRKWTPPKIADTVNLRKQSLDYHIGKDES